MVGQARHIALAVILFVTGGAAALIRRNATGATRHTRGSASACSPWMSGNCGRCKKVAGKMQAGCAILASQALARLSGCDRQAAARSALVRPG